MPPHKEYAVISDVIPNPEWFATRKEADAFAKEQAEQFPKVEFMIYHRVGFWSVASPKAKFYEGEV